MPYRSGQSVGSPWTCILFLAFLACSAARSEHTDELQHWIGVNAVTVRSIDAADENFSDLEPLLDAIGSAEIVQLGEPGHGAGNSFAAKVRLIKFLHQRMGFDVLVWESGMHGMQRAQTAMRSQDDAVSAAQRGVFTIWSNAEEVRPLLEYVKASQTSRRPLEMAGFDVQFTAHGALEVFSEDLRAFVSALHEPTIRGRARAEAERALQAHERLCCALREARERKREDLAKSGALEQDIVKQLAAWDQREGLALQPRQSDLEELLNAADGLLKMIDDHRSRFEQVHGATETSFMEQAIINLRTDGEGKLDIDHGVQGDTNATFRNMAAYFNRREERNANNLRWLIERGYAGRKLIVWAHNVHITRAQFAPGFAAVHVEPQTGDMKPTGAYLAEWFGKKIYTVALTTYHGNDRWVTGNRTIAIPPSQDGSLEARLHTLGQPYLFLDFRKTAAEPLHPARKSLPMRMMIPVPSGNAAIPAHGTYVVDDITRAFDGILFIDETTPATPLVARSAH